MSILNRIREDGEVIIMGILNVTSDSFSDGGKFLEKDKATERALQMEREGADLIDIGGESTRPGAEKVPLDQELARTIPVIKELRKVTDLPISIDTYKVEVAERALQAGANMVNDISALRFDQDLAKLIGSKDVPVVLMHMQGTPKTMQDNPSYEDPVEDIIKFLAGRIESAVEAGISENKIIIDPGIGFGKRLKDNYEILRRLEEFQRLEKPLLLGTSRKSFIGATLDLPPEERVEGTIASSVVGLIRGADILRVHDVQEVVRAVSVAIRCR